MEISKLNQYNFHDSLLEKVSYDIENKALKMTVDLCTWAQNSYTSIYEERKMIIFSFNNVSDYSNDDMSINSDEILSFKLENKKIVFKVYNDIICDTKIISFKANDFEIR